MENELEKEEEFITNKLQAKIRELSEANSYVYLCSFIIISSYFFSKLEHELEEKSPRLEFQFRLIHFFLRFFEKTISP